MFGEGGPSDSRALVLLVFNGTLQDLTVLDCVGEHRGFGTVWESTIVLWDCDGGTQITSRTIRNTGANKPPWMT